MRGGGFLLKVLKAEKKVGVEINASARGCANRLGIEALSTLKEVKGRYDKVISSHTLEHIPNPVEAVSQLKTKLRDGMSRIILLLPLDDWRAPGNREFDPSDANMHLHTWTPQLIGNVFRACDLKTYSVEVITHAWPPYKFQLWNLHPSLFHWVAYFWSLRMKKRQLLAIAGLSDK
jgi:hypothetical protein